MAQQRTGYPLDYSRGAEETAKDSPRGMAEAATDKVKDAAESAMTTAGDAAQQAAGYAEEAQRAVKRSRSSLEESIKEQPLATAAAVCLIGFLLGALWKK